MSEAITDDRLPTEGEESREAKGGLISESDLQRLLEETRGRAQELEAQKLELERRAHEAELRASQAETQAHSRVQTEAEARFKAQESAYDSALSAAKADANRAKVEFARALEAGDHAAAAEAQEALSAATARADRISFLKESLLEAKERFVQQAKAPQTRQPPQQQRHAPQSDPWAGWDLHPAEREFLEPRRAKFLNDPAYQSKVIGASNLAIGDGLRRGSPEYIARIAELIGEKHGDGGGEREYRPSADLPPGRRAAPGASPSREIRLTADQREVADAFYGDPTKEGYEPDPAKRYIKYATNLQKLKEAGRL